MDRLQRFFERAVSQSAFFLTLLTVFSLILVLGFFIRDLHLFSVEGDMPENYARLAKSEPPPETPARSLLDARFSTDPVIDDDSSSSNDDESLAQDESAPWDVATAVNVEPFERFTDNFSEEATKVEPGYVALLTRTVDCRWGENAATPSKGTQFKVGETLNIAAGLAEIAFACGAKAVLEGPAVLEFQSEKSGSLKFGKLLADVPDEVEGFKIRTSTVEILSLPGDSKEPKDKNSPETKSASADVSANAKTPLTMNTGETVKAEKTKLATASQPKK